MCTVAMLSERAQGATIVFSYTITTALQRSRHVLTAIFVGVQLVLSVLLIVLVLLHSGKDAGMASVTGFSFASSASVMERNLTRYTIITGVLWFLNTFLLIFLTRP